VERIDTDTIITDLLEFAGDPETEDFIPMLYVAAIRLIELTSGDSLNQVRPMYWYDRFLGGFFSLLDSIISILSIGMINGNFRITFMIMSGILAFGDEE